MLSTPERLSRVVSLTTDFGLRDSYVAQMKAVLLSLAQVPINLVDISHQVEPCQVRQAARLIRSAAPAFANDSIHLAVIDPGVGSARRCLVIEALVKGLSNHNLRAFFVGPDNGVFSLVAPKIRRLSVWEIANDSLLQRPRRGRTFDGRDIFAPTVAYIANGYPLSEIGPLIEHIDSAESLQSMEEDVYFAEAGVCRGVVASLDYFGNVETNLPFSDLPPLFSLTVNGKALGEFKLLTHYAQIELGKLGCLENSQGFLEIAARGRPASEIHPFMVGDALLIEELK